MIEQQGGGSPPETRAGYVALIGRPNVGKSTLLNTLVGEKLSVVTARAQTTRERVTGMYTDERAQLLFVDTPGLLEPRSLLQQSMLEAARGALRGADCALLLLDATAPDDPRSRSEVLERLPSERPETAVAINKIDAASESAVMRLAGWAAESFATDPLRVSARTGEGVEPLRNRLIDLLPRSPFLYPEDQLAVQPVRFFVAELVRETIFERYREEVPYATVVRIEEYRESEDPLYIRATIYVERKSQKGIVIGRKGAAIKGLGRQAREKIEQFVGARVYLDLWVKPMPGWRGKRTALEHLGYAVPEEA